MLRHVQNHRVYWFCRNCWQAMPCLEAEPVLSSKLTLEKALVAASAR
ncbi:MAG: hypothetical protein IGS38_20325 [Synechococcales cyanobacterium M58_A2018_015]|nr:hypothetical protein [Synechococcales cyanobacterium M58_A2018_015]